MSSFSIHNDNFKNSFVHRVHKKDESVKTVYFNIFEQIKSKEKLYEIILEAETTLEHRIREVQCNGDKEYHYKKMAEVYFIITYGKELFEKQFEQKYDDYKSKLNDFSYLLKK